MSKAFSAPSSAEFRLYELLCSHLGSPQSTVFVTISFPSGSVNSKDTHCFVMHRDNDEVPDGVSEKVACLLTPIGFGFSFLLFIQIFLPSQWWIQYHQHWIRGIAFLEQVTFILRILSKLKTKYANR